jgi:hypothetical protein
MAQRNNQMEQSTIKKALEALPKDGSLAEVPNPSINSAVNAIYEHLETLGYVYTQTTEDKGIIAVGLTDLGKRTLAML